MTAHLMCTCILPDLRENGSVVCDDCNGFVPPVSRFWHRDLVGISEEAIRRAVDKALRPAPTGEEGQGE